MELGVNAMTTISGDFRQYSVKSIGVFIKNQ
jgi:hypothetical protein